MKDVFRFSAFRPLAAALGLALAHCAAAATTEEPPVELPPLIVSDSTLNRPWRYVATPGLEVLARCDDGKTEDLVRRHMILTQLLRSLLPLDLQFQTSAPKMIVLVDGAAAPSLSQGLVAKVGVDPAGVDHAGRRTIRILPNLELHDLDLMAVFAVVDTRRSFDADRLGFTPEHVRILLQRRAPPMAAWFIEGFMRLFPDMNFTDTDVKLPTFTWLSESESRRLRDDPDAPRTVLPAVDFFGAVPGPDDPGRERWVSQAALFVRWALEDPERRTALTRFVARYAVEGQSEALLRDCFHFGYSDWRDRLSDYLAVAVSRPLTVDPGKLPRLPRVQVRDATPGEIGRMKGEWERLEISFVQPRHPEYADQYVQLARRTLDQARERAGGDPGVLTASGLLELDLHRPEAARPFLEAAAMAGKVRPRVYVELARFRLADALSTAGGKGAQLTPGQAQVVLETLQPAYGQKPDLPEIYAMTAEVWARCGAVVRPEQLALLTNAVHRFPASARLLFYTAVVEANQGKVEDAIALAERGVAASAVEATRAQFAALRDGLVRTRKEAQPAMPPVTAPQ